MAKKIEALSFQDIVLGADVETIRQALEARQEIDKLLAEREQAYQRIAELETEVDRLMGDDSAAFPFPEPPLPVAGFGATPKPKAAKPKAKAEPKPIVPGTEGSTAP